MIRIIEFLIILFANKLEYTDKLTPAARGQFLGTCGEFRVRVLKESVPDIGFESPRGKKSPMLMYFMGCHPERHSTITLRGESVEILKKVKRVLHVRND